MPHQPKVLLEDIRLAIAEIGDFTRGQTVEGYGSNRLLRAGVERLFILIGEALSRLEKLDSAFASRITGIRKIIAFRNILVHGYETIDDSIVWQTVQDHLPLLLNEVEVLIAIEPEV
jgi:uncharacterized protein with HEPN domain